jgi:hypothetical protein
MTQWGLDPLWDTTLPKHRSRIADFPARVTAEIVPLLESPATSVHVVGHRVQWDQVRSLWYCDIELDPGATYMPFVRLAVVRYQPNALAGAKISKVVLCEFAQVLPRRRSTFARTGAKVAFTLRGTVPEHGPMQFPLDSEYQDISFIPLPGQTAETGRNKVELVLQTRDPALDTDLAWSDVKVLASSLLTPGSAIIRPVFQPTRRAKAAVAPPTSTIVGPLSQKMDLGTAINVGGIGEIDIGRLIDPAIWQTTVTLPDVASKPARMVVREYERYYTDRTIPEVRGGATHKRRVVEERLVYTAFFSL